MEKIDWLLQGDPAIRYQVLRDLKEAKKGEVESARKDILLRGWGKELMDRQDEEGTWSGALYSPKWTSTFYTLLLLKRFGAPADERLLKACGILLDRGFYEPDGGINYWKSWKNGECCVTGMLLSMLCFFGFSDERREPMVDYLLNEQMADGGWNCERPRGAHHSSFHTTLSVLKGLGEYGKETLPPERLSEIHKASARGIEFLLQHRLYKSDRTWEPVHPDMANISFPPRWHYDIMGILDWLQHISFPWDERMKDAMELLLSKRTVDGYWKLGKRYAGKVFFTMEKGGAPSRWNTLRGLRILRRYGQFLQLPTA
ncbi:MAG: hypothetical protein PQJ60_05495 [Spirochaetales bacterium]|nr:hypothetical protein [Spirochaetales bacterium]